MQITIKNANRSQKRYAESVVKFCASKLMSKRLGNALEIHLSFIPGLAETHNENGACIWEDDNHLPREFTIEIDKNLSLRRALESICHEMVHVKQFASGQMKDMMSNRDHVKWEGEVLDRTSMDYWDLPWEIEANGRETGLFVRWAEQNNLGRYAWTRE